MALHGASVRKGHSPQRKASHAARLRARVGDNSTVAQSHIREHLQDMKCVCVCVCERGERERERERERRQREGEVARCQSGFRHLDRKVSGAVPSPPHKHLLPNTTSGTDESTDQRPLCPNKAPAPPPRTHTHTRTHSAVTHTHRGDALQLN